MLTRARVLSFSLLLGCGASSTPPAAEPAASPHTAPAPTTPALVVGGPLAWNFGQWVRVDAAGVVQGMGTLTAAGELVDDGVLARIDTNGAVTVDGTLSSFRVVDTSVVDDTGRALMHLEGAELVVDEERIPIEGYRPELAREVLFLSSIMLYGMTR